MTWVTELAAALLIAGALVLLGLGKVSFEQALSIITLGIGLLAGKQLARVDRFLGRRYGRAYLLRRFKKYLVALEVGDEAVQLYVLPEFLQPDIVRKLSAAASDLFPGRTVRVVKGERVRAV